MKRVIFIISALFIALNLSAQNDVKHLEFQGLPINGTVTDYMHGLNAKGYKNVGIENGVGILTADISGFRNSIVNVASSNGNTNVYAVSVCFTYNQNENEILKQYEKLKNELSALYGEIVAEDDGTFKEFIYPGYEKAWKNVTLIKDCMFSTPIGKIKLAVFQRNIYTLSIVYVDNVNTEKARQEREQQEAQ
ncbi:MAG: hypothetical protein II937_11210 [Bacteroidales bacterium]|nr:hypothetical protein [Bacteroidales bacterium]